MCRKIHATTLNKAKKTTQNPTIHTLNNQNINITQFKIILNYKTDLNSTKQQRRPFFKDAFYITSTQMHLT